jgi:hypothetical protein
MQYNRLIRFLSEWWIVLAFIAGKLLFHFLTNTNYELHRDSFLYIEQGKHLAWGYASTPPSIGIFASIARFLFGDTTFGIRFFPALIGAASILLIGIMVKESGGRSMALVLACLAFLISPSYLRSNTLFQPVSFNQFYWLLSLFFIFRLIKTNRPVYWILLGIVGGLGILNKHSILVFQASIVVSFLATHHRRWFKTWYPYAGGLIALVIILPHVFWQYQHDWPVVRHMKELADTQLVHVRLDLFLLEQVLMNLPGIIIWPAGLIYLIFHRDGDRYQVIALIFALTVGTLLLLRGKPYYTLGLYSSLFAFGGVYLEKLFSRRMKFMNYLIPAYMLLSGLLIMPVSLPILKPDQYIRFMGKIGMDNSQRWEDGQYHDLPQDYADMIGWKELADIVGTTWQSLSPEQQAACTIFASNYGEAGSVNFYGSKYGLPPVVSYNDSYLLWAPDEIRADYLIKIGDDPNLPNLYNRVEVVGRITTPHARQEGTPVSLCSDPKIDIGEFYKKELADRRKH